MKITPAAKEVRWTFAGLILWTVTREPKRCPECRRRWMESPKRHQHLPQAGIICHASYYVCAFCKAHTTYIRYQHLQEKLL